MHWKGTSAFVEFLLNVSFTLYNILYTSVLSRENTWQIQIKEHVTSYLALLFKSVKVLEAKKNLDYLSQFGGAQGAMTTQCNVES